MSADTDKLSAMERAAQAASDAALERGIRRVSVPDGRVIAKAAVRAYLQALAEDKESIIALSRHLGYIDWEHRRDTVEILLSTLLQRAGDRG
jgi:hypothetical protein